MNSSETSSESLQPLTVPFVMMKIRLVKIAVKSDIANMIALSSGTSLPALFAESAEMLVTWPKTVRIASEELIGATMALVSILAVAPPGVAVMRWIVRWNNSCKNFLEALLRTTVKSLDESNRVTVDMSKAKTMVVIVS